MLQCTKIPLATSISVPAKPTIPSSPVLAGVNSHYKRASATSPLTPAYHIPHLPPSSKALPQLVYPPHPAPASQPPRPHPPPLCLKTRAPPRLQLASRPAFRSAHSPPSLRSLFSGSTGDTRDWTVGPGHMRRSTAAFGERRPTRACISSIPIQKRPQRLCGRRSQRRYRASWRLRARCMS
jgi:hypothetical protein